MDDASGVRDAVRRPWGDLCRFMVLPHVAVRHSRLFMDKSSGDLDAVSLWLQGFECAG